LLPARAEAVPLARQAIRELSVDGATASVVELLTSELVTNAIQHGPPGDDHQMVSLDARLDDGRVVVEVCDEGSEREPTIVGPDPLEPGGLGLRLVDELAADWGTRIDGMRCVWFRVLHPAS
jgi:anti-sigma regulatory factor (Ser/Thr protein kinase)